ncbi:hypothetical protein [Aurantiacibacter spongiae]|uniref:Uncharacterized protein n=1 Tax=Aurantiacibacter spongiae TaxID=2488860 RepID=A0A3N5CV26_9SPHN|nr:hypothetical protein [Aurantiacibacter spongiae]RPF70469.1 hypothetical protein EG799_01605 [Aurantiacibacter spongiae]
MADDWQIGDLALCVAVRHPLFRDPSIILSVGAIYTVKIVGVPRPKCRNERALGFWEVSPRRKGKIGFPESLFRKIRPLTDEEHREAILELAGDVPVLEPANLTHPVADPARDNANRFAAPGSDRSFHDGDNARV